MSEWRPVLRFDGRGYWDGFDDSKRYQFKRVGYDGISHFVLAEMGPLFNVAGLFWRDPLAALRKE